jgi:hypothetical protein
VELRSSKWFRLLLVVPALAFLAIVAHWKPLLPVTGDEPHYLIIADSIARDGDLKVVNNYDEEAQRHAFIGATDRHSKTFWYSVHNPAMPALIALPFWYGGPQVAKLFLAGLMGLFSLFFFVAARRHLGEVPSVVLAVTLGLSMPYLTGAGQLFPDLLSGLFMLGLVVALGEKLDGARGPARATLFHLGLATLPWLHLKQLAPMVVLLGAWGFDLARQHLRGRALVAALAPAALTVGSVVALLLYNQHAFQSWQGPYEPNSQTTELKKIAMIFLGLHFDQTQGVFPTQPLWVLGVLGLPFLARRNRAFFLVLSLVYLSLVVPNAAHTNWYGGLTFAGRFFWSSVSLWVFPLVAFLEWAWKRRWGPALALLVPASLAFQALYARTWYDDPHRLYAWGFTDAAQRGVLVEAFRYRLPTYDGFERYLSTSATWAPLAITLAVVLLGVLLSRRAPAPQPKPAEGVSTPAA